MSVRQRFGAGLRRTTLAMALTLGVALGGAPIASAQSPSSSDARTATTRTSPTPGADRSSSAQPGRLEVAAAALRRNPLYVEDELSWMLDADQTRALTRELRDARVPVLVAVLPALSEDESGGDTRRVLRTLQQLIGRDAVYVTVDERGRFDLASMGIPLNLSISISLLSPPRDERPYDEQAANPGPPSWASVPDRLRELLRYVRDAEPGTPNGLIDPDRLSPMRPPPGYQTNTTSAEDTVAAGIFGLVVGLIFSGGLLALIRAHRRATSTPRRKGRRRA
ncbi:MAG: hypothetical protein WC558_16405 [Patulibacter sp.]